MSIETVNEPIEGHNPFLGQPVAEIAKELDANADHLATTTREDVIEGLQQNRGWLMEALHVEIMWNRTKSNE